MATYKNDQHLGDNLDEMNHVDFWDRVRTGQPLPAPRPTFAYKKFENLLAGLGVNIQKHGNELHLMPLTDKGVLELSHGEIKDRSRASRQGRQGARERALRPEDHRRSAGRRARGSSGRTSTWPSRCRTRSSWARARTASVRPFSSLGIKYDDFEAVAKGQKVINGKTGGQAINDILKKHRRQERAQEDARRVAQAARRRPRTRRTTRRSTCWHSTSSG
jgi:hypothetical protein